MTASDIPDQLPLSLPAGIVSRRRQVRALGVVVLHDGGYVGNWQPIKVSELNPVRAGASWIAAHVIDWSSVR